MRNLIIPTFLAISILFSIRAIPQEIKYNLADYKNPNYKYQSLDMQIYLTNPMSVFDSDDNNFGKGHTFSLRSNIFGVYSQYFNSEKYQSELNFSSGIDLIIGNSKSNRLTFDRTIKSQSGNYYLNSSSVNRFYYTPTRFIEIAPSLGFAAGISNSKQEDTGLAPSDMYFQNKYNSASITLSVPVLMGTGRIEHVQDAQLAMYIVDDLIKTGLLKGNIISENVDDLAKLITRLKYKRAFDPRLQKIAEMKSLDSLILQMDLVKEHGVELYSIIRDNWDYANNPIRLSGIRYFAGIKPSFLYDSQRTLNKSGENEDLIGSEIEQKSKRKRFTMGLTAGIKYEKPINRKIQKSFYATASAGMLSSSVLNSGDTYWGYQEQYIKTFPLIDIESGISYGYYPNTRSWYTLRWNMYTGYNYTSSEFDLSKYKSDNLYLYTGPGFDAYYYLAPNFRLSLHCVGEFRFDNSFGGDSSPNYKELWWNQQIEASLTYKIF